jgi:DNA repair exonuclease SbcCD ATPase subunit
MNSLSFQSSLIVFLLLAPSWAYAQQGDHLTSSEQDRLRDAQDPSERIKVYLSIAQTRLDRLGGLQDASPETQENVGGQVDELLEQYISIDDELKDWIEYQYDHNGDMRSGLHQLLTEAPRQLQQLQHLQNSPASEARDYSASLHDAIANLNDTIGGAAQALAAQEKKFPEMKQAAKAEARAVKKERKAEAKRNKEEEKLNKKEKKLRERHHKKDDAGNSGEN